MSINRTVLNAQPISSVAFIPSSTPVAAVGFLPSLDGGKVFALVIDALGNVSISSTNLCSSEFLVESEFSILDDVLGCFESTLVSLSVLTQGAFVEIGWVEGVRGKQLGITEVQHYKGFGKKKIPIGVGRNMNARVLLYGDVSFVFLGSVFAFFPHLFRV